MKIAELISLVGPLFIAVAASASTSQEVSSTASDYQNKRAQVRSVETSELHPTDACPPEGIKALCVQTRCGVSCSWKAPSGNEFLCRDDSGC